jgi:hypothetical protein
MSENNEFECFCCGDEFPISDRKRCDICEAPVCTECTKERNIINFEEWLTDCSNKCDKCKRIGCRYCISTCYQCWNVGGESEFLCYECSDLSKQKCEYHNHWDLCSKHREDKCASCEANKNYSARHEF